MYQQLYIHNNKWFIPPHLDSFSEWQQLNSIYYPTLDSISEMQVLLVSQIFKFLERLFFSVSSESQSISFLILSKTKAGVDNPGTTSNKI
jgi:hypothetical protein